jgi:glycosyltransferase involved in cell wall biosynthesis
MQGEPVVSVVMATRDRPALAARALQSIAAQRFQDYEVIVVDDGSAAATLEEYRKLISGLGPRFLLDTSVPSGSPGSGPAAVRNRGIRRSTGAFVAFLDDDDLWIADDHLAVAVEAVTAQDADFFFADMQGVRSDRVHIPTWYASPPQRGATRVGDAESDVYVLVLDAIVEIFRHHMIHPDCWVVKRELLRRIGGFNERLRFVEDLELGMRLGDSAHKILYRAAPVVHYRLPESDAESLKYDKLTILLQYCLAAQTLRTSCVTKPFKRCARARESWSLRQIASELLTRGDARGARSFSWQAFATFPTKGSLTALASSLASRTGAAKRSQ